MYFQQNQTETARIPIIRTSNEIKGRVHGSMTTNISNLFQNSSFMQAPPNQIIQNRNFTNVVNFPNQRSHSSMGSTIHQNQDFQTITSPSSNNDTTSSIRRESPFSKLKQLNFPQVKLANGSQFANNLKINDANISQTRHQNSSPIDRINQNIQRSGSFDSPTQSNILYQKTETFMYPNTDRYLEKETIREIIPITQIEIPSQINGNVLEKATYTNHLSSPNNISLFSAQNNAAAAAAPSTNLKEDKEQKAQKQQFQKEQKGEVEIKNEIKREFKLSQDLSEIENDGKNDMNYPNRHKQTNSIDYYKSNLDQTIYVEDTVRLNEKEEEIQELKDLLTQRQKENDELKVKVRILENEKIKSVSFQKHIRTLEHMLLEKHSEINSIKTSSYQINQLQQQLRSCFQLIELLEKQKSEQEVKLLALPIYEQEINNLKFQQMELARANQKTQSELPENFLNESNIVTDILKYYVPLQDHQKRVSILADQIGRLNQVIVEMQKQRDDVRNNGILTSRQSNALRLQSIRTGDDTHILSQYLNSPIKESGDKSSQLFKLNSGIMRNSSLDQTLSSPNNQSLYQMKKDLQPKTRLMLEQKY